MLSLNVSVFTHGMLIEASESLCVAQMSDFTMSFLGGLDMDERRDKSRAGLRSSPAGDPLGGHSHFLSRKLH